MEQSPSREAWWSSPSQELPRILWKPKVHYCIQNSPPPIPILTKVSVQVRGFVKCFVNIVISYGEELLGPRSPPKLKDHPLSAIRD